MKSFLMTTVGAVLLSSAAFASGIEQRTVAFESNGASIVGTLYLPEERDPAARLPGVLVTGAWTSIKEQMSGRYAREMAERGFAALAFDFRGWGQSGGDVRFKEDPVAKTADIVAAAEFMRTVPEVDAAKIAGLGICASAGYMAEAASGNANFRSVSLVAPWLHNREIVGQVYGGAEGVAKLIATSKEAEASEKAGSPQVIVAASTTDQASLMYGIPYYTEPGRGMVPEYDNKFNLASWEPWLTYDSVAIAARLDKPVLIVHSEAAAVPQGAHAFFSLLKGDASELWLENISQFDFYDRPDAVTRAADAAAEHFGRINRGS